MAKILIILGQRFVQEKVPEVLWIWMVMVLMITWVPD